MTLVANFSVDGRPVLLGDLMLSLADDGLEYQPFPTPLHLDPNREVRGRVPYILAGLAQKVVVLTPRLAVAWAGVMTQAEYAIKSLQEHVADLGYSAEELAKLLDECCRSCDELYLTGLMTLEPHEGNLRVVRFCWPRGRGEEFVSARFGDCYIGGSGASDFANLLRTAEESSIRASRTLNECEAATFTALSLAAQLSGEQMRVGSGLAKLYGGGFEVVTVFGKQLAKVGDIGYHLCEARVSTNGEVTVTFHSTIKYAYQEDWLLVRRLVPDLRPSIPIDDCFVIPPVHQRGADENKSRIVSRIKVPPFDSRVCVLYCHVPQAQPPGRVVHLVHYRGSDAEAPVVVIEHADCLEIELSAELLRRVERMVQQAAGARSTG